MSWPRRFQAELSQRISEDVVNRIVFRMTFHYDITLFSDPKINAIINIKVVQVGC